MASGSDAVLRTAMPGHDELDEETIPMATHKLLLLPGDGIGPEVMAEVKRLIGWLNAQGIAHFETEQEPVGGSAYCADKVAISDGTIALAKASDAVLFGALAAPKRSTLPSYEAPPA